MKQQGHQVSQTWEQYQELARHCFLDHVRSQLMRAARVTVPREM